MLASCHMLVDTNFYFALFIFYRSSLSKPEVGVLTPLLATVFYGSDCSSVPLTLPIWHSRIWHFSLRQGWGPRRMQMKATIMMMTLRLDSSEDSLLFIIIEWQLIDDEMQYCIGLCLCHKTCRSFRPCSRLFRIMSLTSRKTMATMMFIRMPVEFPMGQAALQLKSLKVKKIQVHPRI